MYSFLGGEHTYLVKNLIISIFTESAFQICTNRALSRVSAYTILPKLLQNLETRDMLWKRQLYFENRRFQEDLHHASLPNKRNLQTMYTGFHSRISKAKSSSSCVSLARDVAFVSPQL